MVLALVVSVAGWASVAPAQWTSSRPLFWVDLVLGVVAFPIAHQRRRYPLQVALVLAGFGALSALATGPGILAGVSLATRRVTWQIVAVWATVMLAAQVFAMVEPSQEGDSWLVGALLTALVTAGLLVWGMYLGSRRELLSTLRERAERAEAEQELRVTRARLSERARIAREMHDVLAHRITLITMHAGALAYRTDLPPEQIRTTAELIQATSHQALTDLRQVLGVLRDDPAVMARAGAEEYVEPPQPTFTDLTALVAEAQQSGMRIVFSSQVAAAEHLPDQVGRTAYRIVQEGLTNARKHAPGVTVTVTVAGSPRGRDEYQGQQPGSVGRPDGGLAERSGRRPGRRVGIGGPEGTGSPGRWHPRD